MTSIGQLFPFQVFPFVSGYVFTSPWGPNGILELTLIVSGVQCLLYTSMWFVSRKKVDGVSKEIGLEPATSVEKS